MAKIELQNYGLKVIIDDDSEDQTLEEWLEMFKSALRAISFTDDQIQKINIEE